MKYLALLAVLAIFAPVAVYGQSAMGQITIVAVGPTDLSVYIEGELDENGVTNLVIRGDFGSNSPSAHLIQHTFEDAYITHVFELDLPFQSGEVYSASVYNGENVGVILWTPLPVQQQNANSNSNTVEEVEFDLTKDESAALVQTMYEENLLLKPQIANKDRIIFEQLKVIQNLSPKVSNAMFEESSNNLHYVVDMSENSVQSIVKENKLLKSEIEKQQAVIMEQVKVIQNLASEWTNTIFEPTLNHYSMV